MSIYDKVYSRIPELTRTQREAYYAFRQGESQDAYMAYQTVREAYLKEVLEIVEEARSSYDVRPFKTWPSGFATCTAEEGDEKGVFSWDFPEEVCGGDGLWRSLPATLEDFGCDEAGPQRLAKAARILAEKMPRAGGNYRLPNHELRGNHPRCGLEGLYSQFALTPRAVDLAARINEAVQVRKEENKKRYEADRNRWWNTSYSDLSREHPLCREADEAGGIQLVWSASSEWTQYMRKRFIEEGLYTPPT